ncbi:hypothetical protein K469DRAFT_512116, partial [Zopfia rhizophila CBS 207.26]
LLVGRGQGRLVFTFLASHLVFLSSTAPEWRIFNRQLVQLRSLYPLLEIVQTQMRHDLGRRDIVAYPYRSCSMHTQINEILHPVVQLVGPVPYEPYLLNAEPDDNGDCPWCGKQLSRYGFQDRKTAWPTLQRTAMR